jgi:hypothetical protein
MAKKISGNLTESPFEETDEVDKNPFLSKNTPSADYSNLVKLLHGFESLDNRVDQLNFRTEENKKHHDDFRGYVKNLNNEIEQYKNNFSNHRLSEGYVSNFQRKFDNLQNKFDIRQRDINKSIFSDQKTGAQENYIKNLKKLYMIYDDLSKQINTLPDKDTLSQEEIKSHQQAKSTLAEIKDNLLKELNKYEKIDEKILQNGNSKDLLTSINDNDLKNLQLYLDEAKFITSNLTEARGYGEKINQLKQIQGVVTEMTEPGNGLKWRKGLAATLKNAVPLIEAKKNSTKKNHDINHELDRMLKEILKEQEKLLSLLVGKGVLKHGEEKELFNNFSKKSAEIDQKITNNKENQKQLRDDKQKYIELHQQEYKLRLIQEKPDEYIKINSVNNIKDLRKDIIMARRKVSAIQKELDELDKKRRATTGIFEKVFNRIFYGSDQTINKKIEFLEAKKKIFDDHEKESIRIYQQTHGKRTRNSQIYNAIRSNSPDKLKALITDIDSTELYNQVIKPREAATTQIPKKESWVKRMFGRKSKGQGQAISQTK